MAQQVKLFGVWGCPYSARVEIALKIKGVDYEFAAEDFNNKSDELLMYNPITKQLPVFVHNGQPILESLVILEYIDEIWKENPLLPSDPYLRAQSRFWAKFIDEKIGNTALKALPMKGKGTQSAIDELIANLQTLENAMKEDKFFNKETRSKYLDIMGLLIVYWIPISQEHVGKYVFTREMFPEIYSWADEIFNCTIIIENLPNRDKMLAIMRSYA